MDALTELSQGLSQAEEQPQAEQAPQAQEEVPMYELPLGDQVHKIPLTHEIPIKHNGQIVNAPLEKVFNAFRERAHLQDKFSALKSEREEFTKLKESLGDQDQLRQIQDIQKWSVENPGAFEKLWEAYEGREKLLTSDVQGENAALVNEIRNLRDQVTSLAEFKSTFEKEQEERAIQEDVKDVEAEIEKFQSTYGQKYGIDLSKADEEGVSLQARIIQHGLDQNYPDFTSAALTYLGPKLLETAAHLGRTETAKAVQDNTRAGIVGRSATPMGETKYDPTKVTEEERDQAAAAELEKLLTSTQ